MTKTEMNVGLKLSVGHCLVELDTVRLGFLELQNKGWTLSGSSRTLSDRRPLENTIFFLKIRPFLPKFDSLATMLQIEYNLNTNVTSTQKNKFTKEVFPKSNNFFSDFGWTQKHRF
jgi:hypothetical protein